MGLFRGIAAPFRSIGFLSREGMWHLVLVPMLINVALAVGTAWAAASYFRVERAGWAVKTPFLGTALFVIATGFASIILFMALQPIFGAVFNDRLSEKIEERVRGTVPKVAFWTSVGRALLHGLLKLIIYGVGVVAGMALAVTGVGVIFSGFLLIVFVAYDGFDYPLARRSAGFGEKWRYLALHPGQTIGYGVGISVLLFFIPFAFLAVPPLAAAGATLLFLESEDRTKAIPPATPTPQPSPPPPGADIRKDLGP